MTRNDALGADPRITLFTGRLRELLELLSALRELDGSLTTPEGLRGALSVVERLATLLGAEEAWLEWLRRLAGDEALLTIAAGIVDYLWKNRATSGPRVWQPQAVEARDWHDWLPWLIELLEILRALRGAR